MLRILPKRSNYMASENATPINSAKRTSQNKAIADTICRAMNINNPMPKSLARFFILFTKKSKPILEVLILIAKRTWFVSFRVFREFANRLHRRNIFSFANVFSKVLAQEFNSLRRMSLTRNSPIKYWINLLHSSLGLVIATSPSTELSSSVMKVQGLLPARCKVAYLEAATPQLFIGFRRPLVPLSIVQKICLSYLPLSAERSSDVLYERATRLKAKIASPVIEEAAILTAYSPITMSTKLALRPFYFNGILCQVKTS